MSAECRALSAAAPQSERSHKTHDYRPDIDGLRAVAVLAVVGFHAFPEFFPGGFVGVDVFFVISGFLITGIILRELRGGRFTFSGFYTRRIRRIFPALVVVLAASVLFGWFALLPGEFENLGKHVAAAAGFVSNFALWGRVDTSTRPRSSSRCFTCGRWLSKSSSICSGPWFCFCSGECGQTSQR